MNDYLPSVGAEFCAGILSDMLMQDFESPSFASVDLKLTYDPATRKVGIKATGDMLPEAKAIYGDVALTLMITEDQVKSRQTTMNALTGRTTNNQNRRMESRQHQGRWPADEEGGCRDGGQPV